MAPFLNHTIVWCRNKNASAAYLAEVLGLEKPKAWGPFSIVTIGNGVSLDFHESEKDFTPQHYAFLVEESEFDEIFRRIADKGQDYWADPGLSRLGEVNRNDGGRGIYFKDPDEHLLEIITRPYGSSS